MSDRSYIGIDSTDNNEWIAVLWTEGKTILSGPFQHTPSGLGSLVRFITEHCTRPKICLKLAHPGALELIKFIGCIPDVEVVLISEDGLRMHRTWLPKAKAAPINRHDSYQAYLLACCAERIV